MSKLNIRIACPAKPGTRFGNRITALRWQRIFRDLGHRVQIIDSETRPPGSRCDLLIGIHANRSAEILHRFKAAGPNKAVWVAVSGTDVYRDGSLPTTKRSLKLADRVIILQPEVRTILPANVRAKCRLVYQSINKTNLKSTSGLGPKALAHKKHDVRKRTVIVAGHLRSVKDPFRAAMAVRSLPSTSRIHVEHFGGAIEDNMISTAREEMERNTVYQWFGEVSRGVLLRIIAKSWLLVQSSEMEGGASTVAEAVVNGTPVLATRIPGNAGMLGDDYDGYFDFRATKQLKQLLLRCESDVDFYTHLMKQISKRAKLFHPDFEKSTWKKLLNEVVVKK